MKALIFLEGASQGAFSKDSQSRCREGFSTLFDRCGFQGRKPRLSACGGRQQTFNSFETELKRAVPSDFIALWIDSEDPLADAERTWAHLLRRDGWKPPRGSVDDQVLFMTTCMETLFVADRKAMKEHFGSKLQESALPPVADLEHRDRQAVQEKLIHATRLCANPYRKGERSFRLLTHIDPATLKKHLPSFARTLRILHQSLPNPGTPATAGGTASVARKSRRARS